MKLCKCGNRLSKDIYSQCQSCFLSTRKGENHPSYIKNKIRNCIDCGKKLHLNTVIKNHIKCKSCCQKGNLNPHNRPENIELQKLRIL